MKALITGIGGFVGYHLAHHLLQLGNYSISGTVIEPIQQHQRLLDTGIQLHQLDLTDPQAVLNLLDETRPDYIYHLAAQAYVPESFEDPWGTLSNNIHAQVNLLQAIVKHDLGARILVVGSSEEYGPVDPEHNPIDESHPLRPANPYSVSKVTQDLLGLQYFLSHDVAAIRVRPFNHIGPGQGKQFVAPAFALQIAAIEAGRSEPVMYVGNLDTRRDFTDVRDMVRAYQLIVENGEPGEVYNIGSGVNHSIRELLDILLHLTDAPIEVRFDPARARPADVPVITCNPTKIRMATGWTTRYTFEHTLADILEEARTRTGLPATR